MAELFATSKPNISMHIAKRYLRQLTEFGYLEAHGGNKNRTYIRKIE